MGSVIWDCYYRLWHAHKRLLINRTFIPICFRKLLLFWKALLGTMPLWMAINGRRLPLQVFIYVSTVTA